MKNSVTCWSDEKTAAFQETFVTWYQKEHRNLPWRANQDPYRIWISEIMLQQTRVETVIDYFYRFMEWFPTIEALAAAPEDKLLKAWEGLGYYSRARNLKAAAQQIMTEYDGKMPQSLDALLQLKGIGPYTAGAIASIAFNQAEPAIDGNVMRVVSRLFCIDADIAKPASRGLFDEAMREIIDPLYPGEFNQAMMDLGSAICTPTSPKCSMCPIEAFCLANKQGVQGTLPVKSKKMKPKPMYYIASIIKNQENNYLLEQRPDTGLLANMWLFPMQEVSEAEYDQLKLTWALGDKNTETQADQQPAVFSEWPVVWQQRHLGEVTHVFSHLKWHILPFYGSSREELSLTKQMSWHSIADFDALVFPKPQQKLVAVLEKNDRNKNP